VSFTVSVDQFDRPVVVETGQTILDAALAQGFDYPHGCRSGNCGACKSTLISGEVDLIPYSDYALEPGERAQGMILACRAVPWSDCRIATIEPDQVVAHARRVMTCRVRAIERATHDINILRLAVIEGGPLDFSAGQYARVRFASLPARDLSMANRPDQPEIVFHVRSVAGGAVSRYVAESLKAGETVRVEAPFGVSYLRTGHRGPILAIAGATGLAPIKSILDTALSLGFKQEIRLYFGARGARDLYLVEHFRSLARNHGNLTYQPVLSEPAGESGYRTGLVTDAVKRDIDDLDGWKAYIAGPPAMVEAAAKILSARGLRRQDCHADAFYTEAEKPAAAAPA